MTLASLASLASLATGGRDRAASADRRLAVPWGLVVPLAALFAAVDGFWAASMRSAVGAIERTAEPFATWAHQTVVTLPLHVVAVVAALTLAARWFGPAPRGRHQLWTGALVAIAGAAVGTLVLALGAVVDLRLQQGHVELMTHMTPGCGAPCLERIEADGVATAVRGVAWGAALVVVTDLALVAWVMAALGGRLPVTRRSRRSDLRPRVDARTAGLVAALAGSAAIHLAVVPEHLDEWPLAGAFFVVLAAGEGGAAVAVLRGRRMPPPEPRRGALGAVGQREIRLQLRRGALGAVGQRETRLQLRRGALGAAGQRETRLQLRPGGLGAGDVLRRRVLVAAVLLGSGPLLVWLVSRTVGLPFGPGAGEAEAVGQADVAAVALELVTVWLAAALLARPTSSAARASSQALAARPSPAHVRALAVTAVLAVTVAGCTGARPDLLGDVTGPATTSTVPDHGHAEGG